MARIGILAQRAILNQLRQQGVVRDHVQSIEEVIAPHERRDPHRIPTADIVQGHTEDQQRTQAKGNSSHLHHRDPAAILVLAFVGAGGDQEVGNGIDDVADGLDHTDDSKYPQHDPPLRDQVLDAGSPGGLIEIDEIVIQHGRKQAYRKLRQAQPYDQGCIYLFHYSPCLPSFFM